MRKIACVGNTDISNAPSPSCMIPHVCYLDLKMTLPWLCEAFEKLDSWRDVLQSAVRSTKLKYQLSSSMALAIPSL